MSFGSKAGKALLGLAKGSLFFVQHGGAETFYAGLDKLAQTAPKIATEIINNSNSKEEEQK